MANHRNPPDVRRLVFWLYQEGVAEVHIHRHFNIPYADIRKITISRAQVREADKTRCEASGFKFVAPQDVLDYKKLHFIDNGLLDANR